VRTRDQEGLLLLHHLCSCKSLLLVDVQLLVEVWPDALQVAVTGGMLPLHLACQNHFPWDVILYLIDSYPLAAKVQNGWGQLPLHIACFEKLNRRVMERLIQGWPDSVLVSWDLIKPLSKKVVDHVGHDEHYININGDDYDPGTNDDNAHQAKTNVVRLRPFALDIVCDNNTAVPLTMDFVLLLTNGTPPLHFACWQPCTAWLSYQKKTLEKIAALSAPEDWMRFHQGMLPLHCACRSQAEQDMVLWLAEKYPTALRTCTTDTMDSPLHCYLSSSTTTTATTVPNTITHEMTRHDDHVACQPSPLLPMYSFSTVQYLVKHYPTALHRANQLGWLPIHLAAMNNASLTILFYIACHNPESLLQGYILERSTRSRYGSRKRKRKRVG